MHYPKASASPRKRLPMNWPKISSFLDERDAKNQYVLDLGEKLPHTFDLLKQVTPRVPGCMARFMSSLAEHRATKDMMEFVADANADIVRGLIAILQRIYSGQRCQDILEFDVESFFRRIGLDQFITSQRRNGLAGMIQRIRKGAGALLQPVAQD